MFRRQGYGKVVVGAAVRSVLERGGTPMYAHRTANVASRALADALGLQVYGCFFDISVLDLTGNANAQLSLEARGGNCVGHPRKCRGRNGAGTGLPLHKLH